MTKQELIEKYEYELKLLRLQFGEILRTKIYEELLDYLKQLDEPQKVTIPQFVADWIEEGRKHCKDVSDLFDFDFTNEEVGNWFLQEKPFDLVARAWLDGYEVEKEKRYLVRLKNAGISNSLLKRTSKGEWGFGINFDDENQAHTRKELEEAGFGWVFDCPGIEIEEVQDDSDQEIRKNEGK